MIDFLSMGGYALYVWGSYGVTLAAIVIEVVLLRQRRRRIVQLLGALARHNETGTV
jgi:heme exporter protein D